MASGSETQPITIKRAGETLLAVADQLAELLVQIEDEPIDPDLLTIDLLPRSPKLAAFVKPDPERQGGAIMELSPQVVSDVVEAVRIAGWNFAEERARTEGHPVITDSGALNLEPIAELAIQWIMLHEIAHWALGHLGYLVEVTGKADARLSCVENEFAVEAAASDDTEGSPALPDIDSRDYRCMELQADMAATVLLDILQEEIDEEPQSLEITSTVTISVPPSRQVVALAAGLAILLVQRQRGATPAGKTGLRHPSPEARALNVMLALLGWSAREYGMTDGDELRFPMESDEQVTGVRTAWTEVLGIFYRYLTPLAEAIAVEPIFSNATMVRSRIWESSDDLLPLTGHDLLALFLRPDAPPEHFATQGGRELAELRVHAAALNQRTKHHAILR